MKTEKIIKDIIKCLDIADFNTIDKKLDELLNILSDDEASNLLSGMIFKQYTTYKSGYLATLMEKIIRKKPELAQVNHPENFLFKLAFIKGSKELYECYIEEAVEPFLQGKTKDEVEMYYLELFSIADQFNEAFFPKFVRCIKGMDFNGAFAHSDENENIVLINREDYETMNDVVEKYNTIIGRRDILKDLEKRMGMD
jgi:hypothetical protein